MRQAKQDDNDRETSHFSEMLFPVRVAVTTLRSACMVLIALRACRLSEAMTGKDLQLKSAFQPPFHAAVNLLIRPWVRAGKGDAVPTVSLVLSPLVFFNITWCMVVPQVLY